VDSWKGCFLNKLQEVQSKCAQKFEDVLKSAVVPVYSDLSAFLADNGFEVSTPLTDPGHRSFKFELAENAYLLIIFRFTGVDEFELRTETLAPGSEPVLEKHTGRMSDMRKEWARSLFQAGLDRFVDLLGGQEAESTKEAVATV
jgi:hypothetical protein